jgi:hypothetical protein
MSHVNAWLGASSEAKILAANHPHSDMPGCKIKRPLSGTPIAAFKD